MNNLRLTPVVRDGHQTLYASCKCQCVMIDSSLLRDSMVECSLGHEANFDMKLNNHFVRHKRIHLSLVDTLSFFFSLSFS